MNELRPTSIGRYVLHQQIAKGGMATIHIARLVGDEGFSRIVAAKRLHPELAEDPEFVAMFLDEARIASKLHHRNVVPVLDVVASSGEVMLVQEMVHGVPLHKLLDATWSKGQRVPIEIAISIACQVLQGLQAAHEMRDELGNPLHVVHRDISPQNIMVARDGTARLLDFGIAKARIAAHTTRPGTFKGKLAYSAPEQLRGKATQRSDVYSLAVVLWELIVGHRMHADQSATEMISTVLTGHWPTICEALAVGGERGAGDDTWKLWKAVDEVVKRGLALDEQERWQTAAEMEYALCDVVTPSSPSAVSGWLATVGKRYLDKHDQSIAAEEASWRRRKRDDDDVPMLEITLTTDVGEQEKQPVTRDALISDAIHPLTLVTGVRTESVAEQEANEAAWMAPTTERAASPRSAVSATTFGTLAAAGRTTSRSSAVAVGVLAGLAGTLVIAIVMTVMRPGKPTTTARVLVTPPTMTTSKVAATSTMPSPSKSTTTTRTTSTSTPAVTVPVPKPKPVARPKKTPKAKPHPKKSPCESPYYFEGEKKVFKPECL